MPKIGIIGDLHGDDLGLELFVNEHPDLDALFITGDTCIYANEELAKKDKKSWKHHGMKSVWTSRRNFYSPYKIINVVGNHDDYENDVFSFMNVSVGIIKIKEIHIACFGGVYSSTKSGDPISSRIQFHGRDLRFFTRGDMYILCSQLAIRKIKPSVLITHMAPKDVLPKNSKNFDEGCAMINELIKEIRPAYHIFGHHHINHSGMLYATNEIGLGNFSTDKSSFIILHI